MKRDAVLFLLMTVFTAAFAQNTLPVVQSCNNFAFQAYRQLSLSNKNTSFAFSPVSINISLRLADVGARENTHLQIQKIAFNDEDALFIHSNIKDLLSTYLSDSSRQANLMFANGLWVQKNYAFVPEFLQITSNLYNAPCEKSDFMNAADREKAKNEINHWVNDKTNGNIKNLINDKSLTPNTRMVLVNALYFKAGWQFPFETGLTRQNDFNCIDGKRQKALFMSQKHSFSYFQNNELQAIELPYDNQNFSMMILLPAENKLKDIESKLSYPFIDSLLQELSPMLIDIKLPKFKLDYSLDFSETLKAMGITDAFDETADFSGITGNKELYISKIIHKSLVEIDEKGTTAAAATAVVMDRKMASIPTIFNADRPFIYIISDKQTGLILFIGRVTSL